MSVGSRRFHNEKKQTLRISKLEEKISKLLIFVGAATEMAKAENLDVSRGFSEILCKVELGIVSIRHLSSFEVAPSRTFDPTLATFQRIYNLVDCART